MQAVSYRVQLVVPAPKFEFAQLADGDGPPIPTGTRTLRQVLDRDVEAALYDRAQLAAGHVVDGPAVIHEALCTTFVPPGARARIGRHGEIAIELAAGGAR